MYAVYKIPVFIYDGTNGAEAVALYQGGAGAVPDTFVEETAAGLHYINSDGLPVTYPVGYYLVGGTYGNWMAEADFYQFYYVLPEETPSPS